MTDDLLPPSSEEHIGGVTGPADEISPDLAYYCAASSGRQGSYDGYQGWSIHVAALANEKQQVRASLHERLHHELQHTSPWGLLSRFALDLSRQGNQIQRFERLFRFCRESARTVHEAYATVLAIGEDVISDGDLSEDYLRYLAIGRKLAGALPWELGRFQVDAVLRCCMSPSRLSMQDGGLPSLRISELDHADTRPDRRLAKIDASVVEKLPSPEAFGLRGSPTPPELDRYFSAVAQTLTESGIPTLDRSGVKIYVQALIDDVTGISPSMLGRIEVDGSRQAIDDDLQEHARERLYLHSAPLPVELVNETELPRRATDFARHHPELGIYVITTWLPARQLAEQFVGIPEATGDTARAPCLAMVVAGQDSRTDKLLRLVFIPEIDPGPFVRAMSTSTVVLTSASALMNSPGETDFDGIDPLFVLIDGPVLSRILDRYPDHVGLMWNVFQVGVERHLYVIAIRMTVLRNYVWLAVTGAAGRSYLTAWLESLGNDRARHLPTAFTELRVQLDVVISHILETWWYMGQESEALFDGI